MAQELLVLNGTADGTAEVFSVMFRYVIATPADMSHRLDGVSA